MNTIIIGGGGGSSNRRDRQRKDHRWTTLSMERCLLPTGTVIDARPRFRARRRGVPLARAGREECGSISRGATASLCRRIGLVTGAIRKIMETGCSVIRVRAGVSGVIFFDAVVIFMWFSSYPIHENIFDTGDGRRPDMLLRRLEDQGLGGNWACERCRKENKATKTRCGGCQVRIRQCHYWHRIPYYFPSLTYPHLFTGMAWRAAT